MSRSLVHAINRPASFNVQLFKPVLRAYLWALLSVTAPRILSLIVSVVRQKKELRKGLRQIYQTVRHQLGFERSPASFAILLTGAVVLPRAVLSLAGQEPVRTSTGRLHWDPTRWHALRFVCTFAAGLCSFALLNRPKTFGQRRIASSDSNQSTQQAHQVVAKPADTVTQAPADIDMQKTVQLAGRTVDLTIFGVVRATDILFRSLWSHSIPRNKSSDRALRVAKTVDWLAGPVTFVASSYIIMWAWFFSPYNLPTAYQTWISNAASLDQRILQALRGCREGTFVYGKDTGRGDILRPMCRELGLPEEWGDPACCSQIPCAVVHCGAGDNCEWNALTRLARAWLFAMKMYLPINMLIFTQRKPTANKIRKTLVEASRSSAFLATFVALFYYGVCLARRRLGPKVLPGITPQQMDGGLSVSLGCLLCGTSIFIEKPSRRQEIAFFVAPRALATIFPRRYDRRHIWREQLAYATCAAIILTAGVECPRQVRGVFGRLLRQILA